MSWMVLSYVAAALTAVSIVYMLMAIVAAWDWKRQTSAAPDQLPPISILKPLKGADPHMDECLRSHAAQDYPQFEIVFGVNSADDPAIAHVEKLRREFPDLPMQVVVSAQRLGANGKVSNLVQMAARARHDHLVISDSDIRVQRDYLRNLAASFEQPSSKPVGMVTCLYRAIAGAGLWSKIEALGVSADFMPACLVSRLVEGGVHYGLGSTIALTRKALEGAGGFEAVLDYLADDYEISRRVLRAGYSIVLPRMVVETILPEYSFAEFFQHQARWQRAIRSARPGQYLGFLVMFPLFWALLTVLISLGAPWAWWLLGVAAVLRSLEIVVVSAGAAGDRAALRRLWLAPLRDVLFPFIWVAGWFGSQVVWRGEVFRLEKGRLRRE